MNNVKDIEKSLIKIIKLGKILFPESKNILNQSGYIEMIVADKLGHKWNPKIVQNPDAWGKDKDGKWNIKMEYKSFEGLIGDDIQFCGYNLNKINKLKDHKFLFFINKNGGEIIKIRKYCIKEICKKLIKKYNSSKSDKVDRQLHLDPNDLKELK